jgi:thiol-disulfide isomerase/thioredoxin
MKRALIILLPALLAAGCQNKNTIRIDGIIKEKSHETVLLNMVRVNTLVFVDSTKVSKSGKFSFKFKATTPDFYQLGYSNSDFITLLGGPGEKINLVFSGKNLYRDYTVSGSEGSEKIRMLDMRLTRTKGKLDSLRNVYAAASKESGFDKKGPELENEFNNTLKEIRQKNIEFIINNLKSMASIMALYQKIDNETYVLSDTRDLQYMKIVSDTLSRYYPGSPNVQALTEDFKKELNQMYSRKLQDLAKASPVTELDPKLKDISGKRISLSSLKGKIVLLTFWSLESKECIAENLQLKDYYKTYKKKGFEIYQINVDQNEETWRNEVRFDELPWINTREDDPANPENARLFNVKSVPANYLFDRKGEIIATNLHGKALQIKLNQLFSN